MTVAELRRRVRDAYPHVRVRVRTVGFHDLAGAEALCLTVEGDRSAGELLAINGWAREAGVVPDGNLRFYDEEGRRA